jgi:pentatricopeptide repeat protein
MKPSKQLKAVLQQGKVDEEDEGDDPVFEKDAEGPSAAAVHGGEGRKRRGKDGGRAEGGEAAKMIAHIRSIGRAGDLAAAVEVVEEGSSSGAAPRSELQNTLLHTLTQSGDGKSAVEYFETLKASGEVNVVSFNIMLRAYLVAGRRVEAKALLGTMKTHGVTGNKVTLNELLTDRAKLGDRRGMWRIIEEMRGAGFGINKVACSICLKALGEATPKDEVKAVMALLVELSEPMDDVLCSCAIEACLRVKELSLLSDFLQTLEKLTAGGACISLSAATYGSMIKAYGQAHDLKQIWAAWNAMFKATVSPSAVTLGCMVEALVTNGSVDDAWKLVTEMWDGAD